MVLFVLVAAAGLAETDLRSTPILSTDAIVQKLMAANVQRSQTLRGYRGKRIYHLEYHGIFGNHEAEMQVDAVYTAPNRKDFKVVSQSGSKVLINHVLLKLLSSEQEAQEEQNRKELEISPKNYDFSLAGTDHIGNEDYYVLAVSPKGKSKYLYRGKLWVNATDFAVVRMQGEPASNPSMWISRTQIEYRWAKVAGFWLPVHNQSETEVRMGGKALLTIDYINYQVTGVNRAITRGSGEAPTLPDPAAVAGSPH
jgi:hypothetical protein